MKKGGKRLLQPARKPGSYTEKILALALALALTLPMWGAAFVYAAAPDTPFSCPHHREHTAECGYVPPVEETPCNHVHDESCGYAPAVEGTPCTHVHDEACGYVPDTEEAPCNHVHDESCGYTAPVAEVPCNHTHDEACGYSPAVEGSPCTFACDRCVVSWEWVDEDGFLTQEEGRWYLPLPGAGEELTVDQETLSSFLPTQLEAVFLGGSVAELDLNWDLSQFPDRDANPGDYILTASLPEDYLLTDTAPSLEVVASLGGGEVYADPISKYINQWSFIARNGNKVEETNIIAVKNGLGQMSRDEIIRWLKDDILPVRIRGWGGPDTYNGNEYKHLILDTKNPDELKYETTAEGQKPATSSAYKWGFVNIGWKNFPSELKSGETHTFIATVELVTNVNTYQIYVNSNDPSDYRDADGNPSEAKKDSGTKPEILSFTVTLQDIDPSDRKYIATPAAPENVTVNLFDYWVMPYGQKPEAGATTENPNGGDILPKSDNHYHEEGGEGALGATPTGYSTDTDWNKGINTGHLLLFGDGMIHAGLWNKGAGENCRYGKQYAGMEGIVKNVLKDGYPELNLANAKKILTDDKDSETTDPTYNTEKYKLIKDYALTGDHTDQMHDNKDGFAYTSDNIQNLSNTVINLWETATRQSISDESAVESLQYLFDPNKTHPNKTSYKNITGLFQLDDEGYYYYNMRKNFAEFQQSKTRDGNGAASDGKFILYNDPATVRTDGEKSIGNFFPFNKGSEVFNGVTTGADGKEHLTSSVYCANNSMNHHLGMTVNVDFRQPANGNVGTGSGSKPMTFQFSGDDDVWVFIDDVLVLDMGGIHSEVYGIIDFASGNVLVGRGFSVKGIPDYNPAHPDQTRDLVSQTNLKDLYQAAGMEGSTMWSGNTFASNTSHTLKMFYLERGNYDSSIALRFNLQPLLHQRIIKVDQNGKPVQDAEFKLYEATDEGTTGIQCLYTDADIHSKQPFFVKQKKDGATRLVTLTTDTDGSAAFLDESGSYFNFADRGDQYYILKETIAPAGYRRQPVDIVLHYDTKTSSLSVANRWTTGAYGCSLANVTAGGQLKYGQLGSDGKITSSNESVPADDQEQGLVVAVPLLEKSKGNWMALYGSNLQGFDTTDGFKNGDDENIWKTRILTAALNQAKEESNAPWHLEWEPGNQRLTGKIFDLPGLATRYKLNDPDGDMHMVYGIISPNALSAADISGGDANARYQSLKEKLASDSGDILKTILETEGGFRFLNLEQFNRDLRSMIYIPNERRELWVQKIDQDGNPLPGAKFGLYETAGDALKTSGTTDSNGMLIFSPNAPDGNQAGYAKMMWTDSTNTDYYLKEISAPVGYELNDTVIRIKVGTYSIYADAGTADDGVKVMAGVGRLTQTMRQYARDNHIDVTLQDLTAFMQTQPSGSFSLTGWGDAKLTDTEVVRSMNLHFNKNARVDYGLHDQDGGQNLDPYFVTDTGYVRARVQQNYAALKGSQYDGAKDGVHYDNLGDTDITNLFSLLNIVVVTDRNQNAPETGQLTISKELTGTGLAEADYTKSFTFTVTLTDENGGALTGDYKYFFYGSDKSGYISNGEKTLLLHHDDSVTILGLPKGTKFTVTEKSESGWHVTPEGGTVSGTIEKDGNFQANFTNSKDPNNPPTDPKDPPTDPKDPPTDPKDPPTDPKDPPTDPKDPPTDPKDPPTDPKDPPTDPKDPPTDPEDPPKDPENPPTDPENPPENPENPGYPTELPDPNDPDSPDEITIWEDGVPKTYIKVWDPENEEWIYVPENEVPLWGPRTGDTSLRELWTVLSVLSLSGLAALKFMKKKDAQ